MDPLKNISTLSTPQNQKADSRQTRNAAGGYTFEVSLKDRVRRFLILGTEGGTYYVGQDELTREAASSVLEMAERSPKELVNLIMDISVSGLAPKQNPALFALAIAASCEDDKARAYALDNLPVIARTGSHLMTFASYVQNFRGWGRGLRRAVGEWYTLKSPEKLAYQVTKYRQRDGWTHRDLLRLSHPEVSEPPKRALFDWIAHGKTVDAEILPEQVNGFGKAQQEGRSPEELADLISYYNLSWEMLPTEALNSPAVWKALLNKGLPITALLRNLPRITRLGLFDTKGIRTNVELQLTNTAILESARVHPMSILVAMKTYASGKSVRGSSTWTPDPRIVDALGVAFHSSFRNVEPPGKRTMLALDVSGSMGLGMCGSLPITPREASAALAVIQLGTEDDASAYGFTGGHGQPRISFRPSSSEVALTPLDISPNRRMDDNIRSVASLPFGPTDCAAPMIYAQKNGLEVDTFVIYTDNETWYGATHPHQALRDYRKSSGIDARLVTVSMQPTRSSIADPSDKGMLDIVGFDPSVPHLINSFSRGDV